MATYHELKPMLFGLAYRMLGSVADAEDIVHDVFAHYLQKKPDHIMNERAYLASMTTNRCINVLKSARRNREIYVGPWLPEPMPDSSCHTRTDPAERSETIGYAYLVMLQQLSPLERAVFILKESLGFDYESIAAMLQKSEPSCRKTFSRAKNKIADVSINAQSEQSMKEQQKRFVQLFLQAADTGRFQPLLQFLLEDVVLVSDGGGKARAALNPIYGVHRVIAFFEGLAVKGTFQEGFETADLNGEPGLLLHREGRISAAMCVEWQPGTRQISKLFFMVNPEKLQQFNQRHPGYIPVETAIRFHELMILMAMMRSIYCFSSKCSLTRSYTSLWTPATEMWVTASVSSSTARSCALK